MEKSPQSKRKFDQRQDSPTAKAVLPRWAMLGLGLLLTAGVTCGVTCGTLEFIFWNKLPGALVGKWVVQGGEQDGASFDFYRTGTMVGHINVGGTEHLIQARVAVEGDKLFITTQNPMTRRDDTRQQTIKILTPRELVLQDERGQMFRMERAD